MAHCPTGPAGCHRLLRSNLSRSEGVAGLHAARLEAGHEPLLTLRRRAVGEAIRHHAALSFLLEHVVADRGRGLQRRLDVAGLQQLPALLGVMRPDTAEAIGLQFDTDLDAVRYHLVARGSLRLLRLRQDT